MDLGTIAYLSNAIIDLDTIPYLSDVIMVWIFEGCWDLDGYQPFPLCCDHGPLKDHISE